MSNDKGIEIWLRMYEEQTRHIRHHEVLRTQSTNLVVVISAALLALYGTKSVEIGTILIGLFVVVVNVYGLLMSLKHYERSRLHATVSSAYRDKLSKLTATADQSLDDVRKAAHANHAASTWMSAIRAYWLWAGLHLVLIVVGLVIAFGADSAPNPESTASLRGVANQLSH